MIENRGVLTQHSTTRVNKTKYSTYNKNNPHACTETHRTMRPREVVVEVRNVLPVGPEQVVQLRVAVVHLHVQWRPNALLRLLLVVVREKAVEGLEVGGVVAHTRVEGVPLLVEIGRG